VNIRKGVGNKFFECASVRKAGVNLREVSDCGCFVDPKRVGFGEDPFFLEPVYEFCSGSAVELDFVEGAVARNVASDDNM